MRNNKSLFIFLFLIFSFLIYALPCEIPDNGTGTVTLPPIGCDYSSPDEVYMIIDGLPPGTTIELDGPLTNFICGCPICSYPLSPGECEGVGGSLGGDFHCFEATLEFQVTGTGDLTGFTRAISLPVSCEVHTYPRNPGDPEQFFPSDMYRLQGEIYGDPDFDLLRITGGTDNGLPGPGQTILTDLGNGNFNVDSFFDITYQIEFTGAPGGVLDGLGGTTLGYIRIETEVDELDFGDAPDSYLTFFISDGARHLVGNYYLGALIDTESDGIPSPNADGDDNIGSDDEDGVIFTNILTPGGTTNITVTASTGGYLQCWIDYNNSWYFNIPAEEVFVDYWLNPGTNNLSFTTPVSAVIGPTYARFRFSSHLGLMFYGYYDNGEVEDYLVDITTEGSSIKWEQLPDLDLPGLHCHDIDSPPYTQIILADDWLCNGGVVTDIHWWGNYELDPIAQEIRGAGIDRFHLSIHADDPTGTCLPLDPELWGVDVQFSNLIEVNTGLINSEGCPIYLFEYFLEEPFPQIEGAQYWLDITAVSSDPTDPAHWRWQESSRNSNPILCGAVGKANPTPATWNTIVWPSNPNSYSDMAFEINSCPPSTPINFSITKDEINIKLQWDPDPCSLYYNVYSSTDPYAAFQGIGWTLEPTATHISATSWTDPVSTAGSKKFYRVTAEN